MNWKPFLACAVTGGGDTVDKHPNLPITPAQIAAAALDAARAGAAMVHCHVRDPKTGAPAHDTALYAEVVERIREHDTDVIINLTTAMGGDIDLADDGTVSPIPGAFGLTTPAERFGHLVAVRPEICSLDCGSMNLGNSTSLYVAPPTFLRESARRISELGVKPELEVFDLGQLAHVNAMIAEGLFKDPPFIQICLGVQWLAPATPRALMAMVDHLPPGAVWSAFSIGRMEMPMLAQTMCLGGNLRVGLEDNLYLSRGRLATNAELVERAVEIVERLGGSIADATEARSRLGLAAAQ